jgi:NADH:ubiquinone oxidoreductase subunit 5 (subunit L)/multisubunit Na+/H+ antiporter MnhA subunit
LTTHAFFKALLFLGAGSVIHAVHTNEMPLMGGLAKKLPITAIAMFCAWLAIIGFPYVGSGFYSKEAILAAVLGAHHPAYSPWRPSPLF